MTFKLSNDIWREVLPGAYLDVKDICSLCATCRFFRDLFASSTVWARVVQRWCAPFSLSGISRYDWKDLIAGCFPRLNLLRGQVALQHLSRLVSLPVSSPEACQFFLYIYWSGERKNPARMLKITSDGLVDVDLASGTLWMHTGTISDLPLLCYGWNGISSLVDLVMVNRRVAGNRKVLASFNSFRPARRNAERNVNVASADVHGFSLEMHVSTCSR